ncbi:MAG TPA: pyridoxal-phosphate dependent enzyme, partial [Candidatus Polarisedimenticolia bacterium]|nr:pyridoxal-phosphate dependent enzyme [Candidatus Polarisedimenticolia bacterium]
ISGIALAIKALAPRTAVVGVQARGAAPVVKSFRAQRRVDLSEADTIADAIKFKRASAVTLPIIRHYVDEMVEVTEEEIGEAIVRLMEESKLVAEGAGAVGVAALLAGRIPKRLRSVCIVVSGGNIDLNMTARVVEQGLSRSNRYLVLRILIPDKPGRLFGILAHLAERKINVLDVQHRRAGWQIPLGWVEVETLVETRNAAHAAEIIGSLERAGYHVERAERGRR